MTDKELFELCQRYGKEARLARNKFVALLPEVARRSLHRRKGFGSIFEFAAKVGGVSRATVEEVIRVDEKLKEMPKLREKIADVGLSKVKTIANIATKNTEKQWAFDLSNMTKSALEIKARDVRNSLPGEGIPNTTQEVIFDNDHEQFSVKLDPRIILKLKILKNKMGKGTTWNELFLNLTTVTTPRPQKNPKPSNPESRQASTKQKREALEKTNGKCTVNGCNEPVTEIHHEEPWARNKSHEKLKPLCEGHHELEHQTDSTIDKKFRTLKMQVSFLQGFSKCNKIRL